MEVEQIKRVLEVIYPDSIPRSDYSKVIEILAEIGQMIQNTPEPVFIPVSGTPRRTERICLKYDKRKGSWSEKIGG